MWILAFAGIAIAGYYVYNFVSDWVRQLYDLRVRIFMMAVNIEQEWNKNPA